jgi:hypothetical protein
MQLIKQGATVIFYKEMPKDVPGFANLERDRKKLKAAYSLLNFRKAAQDPGSATGSKSADLQFASLGKGRVIMGDDLDDGLRLAGIKKMAFTEKGLSGIRRSNPAGMAYFISNRTGRTFDDIVSFEDAMSIGLFDPMTGQSGLIKKSHGNGAQAGVRIRLKPFESIIVQLYATRQTGSIYKYSIPKGEPLKIGSRWTLTFLEGGPTVPGAMSMTEPAAWTNLENAALNDYSGTAKYSTTFESPSATADGWLLDLGKVNETAEVLLNGKQIATLIGPSFQCVIPATAIKPTNKLEVIVANLMANRIAWMDRKELPWKIFYNTNMPARKRENVKNGLFDAAAWKPLPSGLSGPVTLTPIAYE